VARPQSWCSRDPLSWTDGLCSQNQRQQEEMIHDIEMGKNPWLETQERSSTSKNASPFDTTMETS
jgi:hypothetical protein